MEICPDHGVSMIEFELGYEPGRCLGRWFKCTHGEGTSEQCTRARLIESEELKTFHKTGAWPKECA